MAETYCMNMGGRVYDGIGAAIGLIFNRDNAWKDAIMVSEVAFATDSYGLLGHVIDLDDPQIDINELCEIFTKSATLTAAWERVKLFEVGSKNVRHCITLRPFLMTVMSHMLHESTEVCTYDAYTLKAMIADLEGKQALWKAVIGNGIKVLLQHHCSNGHFLDTFMVENMPSPGPVSRMLVSSMVLPTIASMDIDRYLPSLHYCYDDGSSTKPFLQLWNLLLDDEISREALLDKCAGYVHRHANYENRKLCCEAFFALFSALCEVSSIPSAFYRKLAIIYTAGAIGSKPKKPTDWARNDNEAYHPCCGRGRFKQDCKGCQVVLTFLREPAVESRWFKQGEISPSCEYLAVRRQKDNKVLYCKTSRQWSGNCQRWNQDALEFRQEMNKLGDEILDSRLGSDREGILSLSILDGGLEACLGKEQPMAKRQKTV